MPTVIAVAQLVPPSKETCVTSFVPRIAEIVPVTVRFALPSLVIKSVGELPASLVILTITGVWVGPLTIDNSFVVGSFDALLARSVTVAVTGYAVPWFNE